MRTPTRTASLDLHVMQQLDLAGYIIQGPATRAGGGPKAWRCRGHLHLLSTFSWSCGVFVLQVVRKKLPTLKDWTDGTLDADGNYTTGSGVHQLGILLEIWLLSSIADPLTALSKPAIWSMP